jgi:hypothetical protein
VYIITDQQLSQIYGGLTEKQQDSLLGKAGGYALNFVLLSGLCVAGFVTPQTVLLTGVLSAAAKMGGTYLAFENKDWIKTKLNDFFE